MPGRQPQTTGRSYNKKALTYSSTNAKSNNINLNSNNKNESKNNVDMTQFFKKRKANDICEEKQSNELKEVLLHLTRGEFHYLKIDFLL